MTDATLLKAQELTELTQLSNCHEAPLRYGYFNSRGLEVNATMVARAAAPVGGMAANGIEAEPICTACNNRCGINIALTSKTYTAERRRVERRKILTDKGNGSYADLYVVTERQGMTWLPITRGFPHSTSAYAKLGRITARQAQDAPGDDSNHS